ncbi:MAG TPA: DUF2867 domain-containing protein, partial [Planctomycetaceae bacterium]|nr:DUF2867 domain-containing protein [Planctomycetaceae bacterium]
VRTFQVSHAAFSNNHIGISAYLTTIRTVNGSRTMFAGVRALLPGEVVDFWRVEEIRNPGLLRLRAEAKLPGLGWLQWETAPERGGTRLVQTAAFVPRGLTGAVYWYSLYPSHRLIFTDLIRAIGEEAVRLHQQTTEPAAAEHPH